MPNAPVFYSLWAINAALDSVRLRSQLDDFKKAGLDGVVFHPRFYPNVPPYLSDEYLDVVSDTILYAKSLGLRFWIYDENGWPSGTVGGELLRRYPGDAQQWLGLVEEKPEDCVGEFDHNGGRRYLERHHGPGVDYLSRNLCNHFIELTYERYRTGLAPEAFEHVEAFFCDEPEFGLGHVFDSLPPDGAIPWTNGLLERYKARYADDLSLDHLWVAGEHSSTTRIRFWEMLRDLFCEAFLGPLNAWCKDHGKLFAAHIKGEEHPLFQVQMVGSCDSVFQSLSLPGIDSLERDPGNDYFPRQLASSAAQFGTGRCMAEAFGGAGWGAGPEDLEQYLIWLGRHGITDFIMHLSQYQLDSAAIQDWPPSQPLHLTWRDAYPEVLRRVRQRLIKETQPDTLVITPHRGIMAACEPWELLQTNIHNAATYPDSPAASINTCFLDLVNSLNQRGINPHFVEETTFERATLENASLRLGNCVYNHVIAAEGCLLSEHGRLLAEPFKSSNLFKIQDFDRTPSIAAPPLHRQIAVNPIWTICPGTVNQYVLDAELIRKGQWRAELACESHLSLELHFTDSVLDVSVNGHPVKLEKQNDSYAARINPECLNAQNTLSFVTNPSTECLFVWLEGEFLVRSLTPYSTGGNGTCQTAGPFTLVAQKSEPHSEIINDLISDGYPFCRMPIAVTARIALEGEECADTIHLEGISASAARLTVDGIDAGYTYGPDWQFKLPRVLQPGRHDLRLELIPSGYNFFGPHHHMDGDVHVASPDQFKGRKNFADREEAPEHTQTAVWNFVPTSAPSRLILTGADLLTPISSPHTAPTARKSEPPTH